MSWSQAIETGLHAVSTSRRGRASRHTLRSMVLMAPPPSAIYLQFGGPIARDQRLTGHRVLTCDEAASVQHHRQGGETEQVGIEPADDVVDKPVFIDVQRLQLERLVLAALE